MKTAIISFLSIVLLIGCGGDAKPKDQEKSPKEKVKKECTYSIKKDAKATVNWTAYKFTKRAGVGGVFDKVLVVGNVNKSNNVTDVINGTRFTIHTASINSKNEGRDAKLVKSFFGSMVGSETMSGKILEAKGDNAKGSCIALLKLNDVEKEIALTYKVEGEKIFLEGKMDLTDWEALDAVKALNEVCSEKHTGENGESILWPDVDVKITCDLSKECN